MSQKQQFKRRKSNDGKKRRSGYTKIHQDTARKNRPKKYNDAKKYPIKIKPEKWEKLNRDTDFEKRSRINQKQVVAPTITMTHDFMMRNVYKPKKKLPWDKRNHPSSHYRYRFHHSNTRPATHKDTYFHEEVLNEEEWKERVQTKKAEVIPRENAQDKKSSKRGNARKEEEEEDNVIPFFFETEYQKKRREARESKLHDNPYLRDEQDIMATLKLYGGKGKYGRMEKWIASKLKDEPEIFEGGLDIKGALPLKVTNHSFGHSIGSKVEVCKYAMVLGCVTHIFPHFVRITLYRSVPAVLTIREVSDVLALEIDHLIGTPSAKGSVYKNRLWQYPDIEVMPTMKDLFQKDQIVRVMVLTDEWNEELSGYPVTMRPSVFNARLTPTEVVPGFPLSASVLSVEDKGYILDCGIALHPNRRTNSESTNSLKVFLRFEDMPSDVVTAGIMSQEGVDKWLSIKSGALHHTLHQRQLDELVDLGQSKFAIPVGFPLEVVVKEKDISQHVLLASLDFTKYYRSLRLMPPVRVEELQPGHVVNATIYRILNDGLVLEFAKVYQGIVHHSHMDHLLSPKWHEQYSIGQQVLARIICINPEQQRIALSLKTHLVHSNMNSLDLKPLDAKKKEKKKKLKSGGGGQWLGKTICYETQVPRNRFEIITADVRRLAYGQLYCYSKLLDPQFLYKKFEPDHVATQEDDQRDELLQHFPSKCSNKLQHLIPIRISRKHLESKLFAGDGWKRENVKVKLLRWDPFQGEFLGSLLASELGDNADSIQSYTDIRYGRVYKCTVSFVDLEEEVVEVFILNGLRGYITKLHLFEHPIEDMSSRLIRAKYFKGAEVTCRCLSVNINRRGQQWKWRVNLSAKPSLVTANKGQNPITIFSYHLTRRDQISVGIICAINDMMGYIVLHFYKGVQGTISREDLHLSGYIKKPSEEFHIGQTLRVRVVDIRPSNQRIFLSLNTNLEKVASRDPNTRKAQKRMKRERDSVNCYWAKIVMRKPGCFVVKRVTLSYRDHDGESLVMNQTPTDGDDDGDDVMKDENRDHIDSMKTERDKNENGNEMESEKKMDCDESPNGDESRNGKGEDKKVKNENDGKSKGSTVKSKRITIEELQCYAVLPFEHLCDDATRSLQLVRTKAFDIGDSVQVLVLHRVDTGRVFLRSLKEQLQRHNEFVETLGLDPVTALSIGNDQRILSVVTAKAGLIQMHTKQFSIKGMAKLQFPKYQGSLRVGDKVMGYLSSKTPSTSFPISISFADRFWKYVHWNDLSDIHRNVLERCIKASFGSNDSDDVQQNELRMYTPGDLVMAKVTAIKQDQSEQKVVTLSMKTSDLIQDLLFKQMKFYNTTFLDEWYLAKAAERSAFIRRVTAMEKEADRLEMESMAEKWKERGYDETKKERKKRQQMEEEREEKRAIQKAAWGRLQTAMLIKCRIASIDRNENCVFVDFVPPIDGVISKFTVKHQRHWKTLDKWNTPRAGGSKQTFECTVLNVEWNINDSGDHNEGRTDDMDADQGEDQVEAQEQQQPVVELFDPIGIKQSVGDVASQNTKESCKQKKEARIVFVDREYLLVSFLLDVDGVKRVQLGIVPMRLPYLFVPTTKMFRVGELCSIKTIDPKSSVRLYGGLIPCLVDSWFLLRKIRRLNQNVQRQKWRDHEAMKKEEKDRRRRRPQGKAIQIITSGTEQESNDEEMKDEGAGDAVAAASKLSKKRRRVKEDTSASEMEELPELETEDEARRSDAERFLLSDSAAGE